MSGNGPRVLVSGVAMLALIATNVRAWADTEAIPIPLEERVEQLDQQVRILSRRIELDREEAAARSKSAPALSAGADGFGFRSQDKSFQLRFRGTLQADSRWYLEQPGSGTQASDTFVIRRVRPVLEGTLHEKYGFRIMPEWAGSSFSLLDMHLDANFTPQLRVRAGKFKSPVGLERLQSPADLLLMERAFPTQLVPNRDVGVQLHGDLLNGTLNYAAGLFDGTVDGSSTVQDNNDGKDIAVRVFAHPFRNTDWEALTGLSLGMAFTTGNQSGTATAGNLPSFLTPGQITFFTYATGAFADGQRQRISPQFFYGYGPFGVLGEYVVSSQQISRTGNAKQRISNSAWQLALTYVLTGEDARLTRVAPHENFDWRQSTWGALELLARVSQIKVDDDVFTGGSSARLADPTTQARKATDYAIGMNWHLNRAVKLAINYEITRFDGGAINGDKLDERVVLTRLQIAY